VEFTVMFRETVSPGLDDPEDKARVTPCAKQVVAKVIARTETDIPISTPSSDDPGLAKD
jgi:hypothetical protein